MRSDLEKKLDLRLVERNLEDGSISKKELNEYLGKLPDLSEEAEWLRYGEDSEERPKS